MNEETNKIELIGTVISIPRFSHSVMGENFNEFALQCGRLSGNDDILPIIISERFGIDLKVGDEVFISGQIRTFNKFDESVERNRLILSVFARGIEPIYEKTEDKNVVALHGFLCKNPIYRTTPFGREICDCLIACNRAYQKSDYIPLIIWGRNARMAKDLEVGDEIFVNGRLQSREYIKHFESGDITRVAYEVSVSSLVPKNVEKR